MKKIILICCLLFAALNSCHCPKPAELKGQIDFFYLIYSGRRRPPDTIKIKKLQSDISKFNIIEETQEKYGGRNIKIKEFTNVPNSFIDGDMMGFWEENLGIFYERSLCWYSFSVLHSNNDSINSYINMLMGMLLMKKSEISEKIDTLKK